MIDTLIRISQIIALGMGTVFSALIFFAVVIWIIAEVDERYNAYLIKEYAKKVEAKEVSEEDNDEIIAVITAAAFEMVKKPIKLQRIQFLSETRPNSWSSVGRSTLMSSHTMKKG